MTQYGTISDWAANLPLRECAINGVTYREKMTGVRECLIVRDYINLTEGLVTCKELLCYSQYCIDGESSVFIDLGHAETNHDLVINPDSGTIVYVNGCSFTHMVGLMYLGDGSWGVQFDSAPRIPRSGMLGLVKNVYDSWLKEVYEKVEYLGLISYDRLHERSIWHLLTDILPKGKIIVKEVQF